MAHARWALEIDAARLTSSVEHYITHNLISPTNIKISSLTGARCWRHRKHADSCRMRQGTPVRAKRVLIIHHNKVTLAPEPTVYCSKCYKHNHARGNTTRLYKAIKHSCGKWPERSATRRESPFLWRVGKGVGPKLCNQMLVFDSDSQRYETLYLLDQDTHGFWTRLITERALIEINRHVFRRYAGCPGEWLSTFTCDLHKFCIWCE